MHIYSHITARTLGKIFISILTSLRARQMLSDAKRQNTSNPQAHRSIPPDFII